MNAIRAKGHKLRRNTEMTIITATTLFTQPSTYPNKGPKVHESWFATTIMTIRPGNIHLAAKDWTLGRLLGTVDFLCTAESDDLTKVSIKEISSL